ncbi:MAG: hypothetical protein ACREMO_03770 [Gemmatimonadales bacterium]
MRWLRLLLRVGGWLLTPLVAWAASFCGAFLGTVVAGRLGQADPGLMVTVLAGIVSGFGVLLLWMRLLRRSPRLRHSLHLTREGIPQELLTGGKVEPTVPAEEAPGNAG